jgi:type IV pilus assembly protein PilX
MALVTALLLLAIVTILAVGMFRGIGVQERIAGNLREKQRALHAAESAQQYAEWWLSTGNNAATAPVPCDTLLNANLSQVQICSNKLTSVTAPPLQIGGADQGVTYNPGNALKISTTSARETYYAVPRFYIADVGQSADATGEVYRIDAVGYGGNPTAVAVVESTFVVRQGVVDRGGP